MDNKQEFPEFTVRVLQGVTLNIPNKFKPGHVLTFEEATFASAAHAAAARSAFEDTARAMKDENRVNEDGKKIGAATDDEVQEAFAKYFDAYVWSQRGTSEPVDPLEAEIRKLARAEMNLALKQAGKTLAGTGKDAQEFALQTWIENHRTRLEKAAKKNLDNAKSLLSEDFLSKISAKSVGGGNANGAAEAQA